LRQLVHRVDRMRARHRRVVRPGVGIWRWRHPIAWRSSAALEAGATAN
jgi:hypothetical protein